MRGCSVIMERHRPMATAMIYDTLKLAEQLEHEAGFDSARARAMARIFAESASGNLATREDLLVVKGELESAIRALDGKVGVLYWMTGTMVAGMAALLGTDVTIALHLMRLG